MQDKRNPLADQDNQPGVGNNDRTLPTTPGMTISLDPVQVQQVAQGVLTLISAGVFLWRAVESNRQLFRRLTE